MEEGIEYLITPAGGAIPPLIPPTPPTTTNNRFWASTPIGVPIPNPLIDFRVGARYYKVQEEPNPVGDPNPDPDPVEPTKEYPGFTLLSMTLECISPSGGDVFHEGTPPLYEDFPEFPTFTPEDGTVYGLNAYAVGGITDGAAYRYAKVFDRTKFRIIPRDYDPPLIPPRDIPDEEVDDIPLEPYDPENEIFPYQSITTYKPDTRTNVLITYRLTTSLRPGGIGPQRPVITETINIKQWVTQTIYDWGPACRYYACRGEYAYNDNDNYCPVGPINVNEYPF